MESTMIQAKHLSCKSGYRYLLKDINWTVFPGQHWVVFGMNGSGKTTLLSVIAGYKAFTSGELAVFDQHYNNAHILDLRRRIGWVSSSFYDRYFKKESALNIVLSGKFGTFGLSDEIEDLDIKKAKALLKELHVKDKVNQPFYQMSKGERQNVLIARALMAQPEILVLDEPSSGLDLYARAHLMNTVKDLAEKTNITIIYVTHYTEEILDIFQHALLLKNGEIYCQGETQAIFNDQVISDFLEYPATINRTKDGFNVLLDVQSSVTDLI